MDERKALLKELANSTVGEWAAVHRPPVFDGETRVETRNTIYRFMDGVCFAVSRRDTNAVATASDFIGMRIVGWLVHGGSQPTIAQAWRAGAYAVLWRQSSIGDSASTFALTSPTTDFVPCIRPPSASELRGAVGGLGSHGWTPALPAYQAAGAAPPARVDLAVPTPASFGRAAMMPPVATGPAPTPAAPPIAAPGPAPQPVPVPVAVAARISVAAPPSLPSAPATEPSPPPVAMRIGPPPPRRDGPYQSLGPAPRAAATLAPRAPIAAPRPAPASTSMAPPAPSPASIRPAPPTMRAPTSPTLVAPVPMIPPHAPARPLPARAEAVRPPAAAPSPTKAPAAAAKPAARPSVPESARPTLVAADPNLPRPVPRPRMEPPRPRPSAASANAAPMRAKTASAASL